MFRLRRLGGRRGSLRLERGPAARLFPGGSRGGRKSFPGSGSGDQAGLLPVAQGVAGVRPVDAEGVRNLLKFKRLAGVPQDPQQDFQLHRAGEFQMVVHKGARNREYGIPGPEIDRIAQKGQPF